MISFSEAQERVLSQARSFGTEKISLDNSVGRVIAEAISADRDYPPFNRAGMDGYAINYSDWNKGLRSFVIREVIFAGQSGSYKIGEGDCYKIMTGAAVPEFADAIIRREDVFEQSGMIKCSLDSITSFQNIAIQGADLKRGETIISSHAFCRAGMVAVLASLGKENVVVEKLPSISIITTGNEVMAIGDPVNAVQIRNSNRHVLLALLKDFQSEQSVIQHVRDNIDEIRDAILGAMKNDILILSGAVSAGDADFVPEVLSELGAEQIFHRVAIRPGKPIWFGKFENGPVVFGLPGNPLSCLVTFKIFIEPFLFRCFGLSGVNQISLPLKGRRTKKTSLDEFFPVRIVDSPSCFEIIPFNGSGDITAALFAEAIARHPVNLPDLDAGTIVEGYPLSVR